MQFHFLFEFLQFADNGSYDKATRGSKRPYEHNKPIIGHLNAKFRRVWCVSRWVSWWEKGKQMFELGEACEVSDTGVATMFLLV